MGYEKRLERRRLKDLKAHQKGEKGRVSAEILKEIQGEKPEPKKRGPKPKKSQEATDGRRSES